jgi:hypothetical protein
MQDQEYEIKELVQKVERVLSYIENDTTTGRKGLFAQVEENRTNIEDLQRSGYIRKGMGIGWGAAGAAIFFLLKILWEMLNK